VILVHGEESQTAALAESARALGQDVVVPELGEELEL